MPQFSRHLVVHLTAGAACATTAAAGALVKAFLRHFASKRRSASAAAAAAAASQPPSPGGGDACPLASPESARADGWQGMRHDARADALFAAARRAPPDAATPPPASFSRAPRPTDEEVCVIDGGVYTRNRAFRTYLSSKFGKTATLQPTRACLDEWAAPPAAAAAGGGGDTGGGGGGSAAIPAAPHADPPPPVAAPPPPPPPSPAAAATRPLRWLFFASLVGDVSPDAPLLTCDGDDAGGDADTTAPHRAHRRATRCGGGGGGGAFSSAPCPFPRVAAAVVAAADARAGIAASSSSSSACATAVSTAAAAHGLAPASVKSWAVYPATRTLILSMHRSHRFCSRVGRPHKSNSVFWVASLASSECCAFQKCYDASCAGYRGEPVGLDPAWTAEERAAMDAMAREAAAAAAEAGGGLAGEVETGARAGPSATAAAAAAAAVDDDAWWAGLSEHALQALTGGGQNALATS